MALIEGAMIARSRVACLVLHPKDEGQARCLPSRRSGGASSDPEDGGGSDDEGDDRWVDEGGGVTAAWLLWHEWRRRFAAWIG